MTSQMHRKILEGSASLQMIRIVEEKEDGLHFLMVLRMLQEKASRQGLRLSVILNTGKGVAYLIDNEEQEKAFETEFVRIVDDCIIQKRILIVRVHFVAK